MTSLLEWAIVAALMIVGGVAGGWLIDALTGGRIRKSNNKRWANLERDYQDVKQEQKEIQEKWQQIKSVTHDATTKPPSRTSSDE
jgi:hypothetical protein